MFQGSPRTVFKLGFCAALQHGITFVQASQSSGLHQILYPHGSEAAESYSMLIKNAHVWQLLADGESTFALKHRFLPTDPPYSTSQLILANPAPHQFSIFPPTTSTLNNLIITGPIRMKIISFYSS